MQDNNMRWVLDQFTRRRINEERMACAKAALAALVARTPAEQSIDPRQIASDAIAISNAMVATFVEEKLF